MYLNKIFHLTKSWSVIHMVLVGVNQTNLKMNQKINFLTQFQPFLNTSIKTVAYLINHLARHHRSKI